MRSLPASDERFLLLGTLTIRDGQFDRMAPPSTPLLAFVGTSSDVCDAFLTNLVHLAIDDALARARAHGLLPQRCPT